MTAPDNCLICRSKRPFPQLDVPLLARLEAINKINVEYVLIRASVGGDVLYIDHDILLNDGLSKRSFALTVKRFCSIPTAAVREHAAELLQ